MPSMRMPVALTRRGRLPVNVVFFAAVVGAAIQGAAAPPFAATSRRCISSTFSGFVLPWTIPLLNKFSVSRCEMWGIQGTPWNGGPLSSIVLGLLLRNHLEVSGMNGMKMDATMKIGWTAWTMAAFLLASVFLAGCSPAAFKTGVGEVQKFTYGPDSMWWMEKSASIVEKNPLQMSPGMGRVVIFRYDEAHGYGRGIRLVFKINDDCREVCIGDPGCFTWQQGTGPAGVMFYTFIDNWIARPLAFPISHEFEVREGAVVFLRVHYEGTVGVTELAAEEGYAMLAKRVKAITFAK